MIQAGTETSDLNQPVQARLAGFRSIMLLIGIGLLCLLPGLFAIPVVDRDEARFAQATRQMVESGDYITPRLGDEPRYKKPIGIYWLQAAVVKLGGSDAAASIGYYRLPSFAAALASVIMVYLIGARLFGQSAALMGALLFISAPILGAEAHLAKTDAVQCLAALLGQFALMRLYIESDTRASPRHATALLFWTAMGIGILVKGPIVPMLAALTIAALVLMDRKAAWLRALRPAIGLPVMLLIVLPWFIAILLNSGTDFLRESVGNDLLGKVSTGQESHGKPPGWHALTALLTYWPGAFTALAAAPWVWANRQKKAVRFCLAWLLPFWIVFELIVTKLPHYTLPAAPAALLLVGAALTMDKPAWETNWRRLLLGVAAGLGIALAIALPITFFRFQTGLPSFAALSLSIVIFAMGSAALLFLARRQTMVAVRLVIAEAIAAQFLVFGLLLPQVEQFWIAPRAAETLSELNICASPQIMVAGMNEASMLFALGRDIRFGDGRSGADFLNGPDCRILLLSSRQRPVFDEVLRSNGRIAPEILATVNGFNLGGGKPVSLQIMASPATMR